MSERKMTEAQVARLPGLPGAREDYKWGGIRVFSVAGNKMFAVSTWPAPACRSRWPTSCFSAIATARGSAGALSGAGEVGQHGAALPHGA
jgi:hypothetical protein